MPGIPRLAGQLLPPPEDLLLLTGWLDGWLAVWLLGSPVSYIPCIRLPQGWPARGRRGKHL